MYCKDTPLADIAKTAGTPAYVYSREIVLDNYRAYDEAFGNLEHTVCYAVKANSSLGILSLLAQAGSGFDIVSAGATVPALQPGGGPEERGFFCAGQTSNEDEKTVVRGVQHHKLQDHAQARPVHA